MSWASHPTTEMVPPSHRRHRRGRRGVLAMIGVLILLLAALGTAIFAPSLLGWPDASSASMLPGPSTSPSPGTTGTFDPLAAPAASATTPTSSTPPKAAETGLEAMETQLFALTNSERAKRSCPALRLDAALTSAARMHSADMVNSGYFSHESPDGRGPAARMIDAGYNADRGWAENIARGYPTVDAVMAGWMGSPGHAGNILNCAMKSVGIGAARAGNGRIYWTQDFGGR